MRLLDRYLQAVRFWLPRGQRQDIIAELSEDIRSQVEEQEASLGRPLTEAEEVELLKRRGEPMRVAAGYLPQQHLIGPALFPVYALVLKILAWVYFVPWVLVWVAMALGLSSYRAAHPGLALLGTWASLWHSALATFGVVTLVFAVLDRSGVAARGQDRWDPRKLPEARDPRRISRSSMVIELVAGAVFITWSLRLRHLPAIHGDGVSIAPGGVWRPVYWILIALWLAGLTLAFVNLLRPWWTRARAWARLALDAAGLVPVALLLGSPDWIVVTAPALQPGRIAAIYSGVHLALYVGVLLMGLIVLGTCARDIVRLARWPADRPSSPA